MAKRALILGARHGNIGATIAARLRMDDWNTSENDCVVGIARGYDVPIDVEFQDYELLVVSLGRVQIEPFYDVDDADIDDVLNACLGLPLKCVATYVSERRHFERGGQVVMIGSYNHNHPLTHGVVYSAAKAGLAMACKALAWELSDQGFTFQVVHPFHVPGTPMDRDAKEQAKAVQGRQGIGAPVLQPEAMRPDDVAEQVAALADSRCKGWLSGANIEMYGGSR